jgi:tetratricopeptide (TPR) repeat protein
MTVRAAAAVLVCLGALIYINGLNAPFLLDDVPSIVENPYIRELWPPSNLLRAPENTIATARPLVSASLALNYAAGGLEVRGYRLFNIAVHLLSTLALFGVVRRTLLTDPLRDRFGAAATGLAFAVALLWMTHPLQTESVNYISQRTESMMGLFFLVTLYCAIRAAFASGTSLRCWSISAVVACAAGMASKQVMVTAPLLVALWDWTFLSEPFKKVLERRWRLYAGLASTWLLLGVLTLAFRDTNVGTGVSPWEYALSQAIVIAQYLRRAIWPTGLLFDYGLAGSVSFAEAMPYMLLIAVLLAATAYALIRVPAVGFLGAWLFLILAPTSSVLPLSTEVGAERRMYLPLVSVVVLAVIGAYLLIQRTTGTARVRHAAQNASLNGRVTATLLVVVAATFCWLTVQRNEVYEDPLALWASVVEEQPRNYRARNNYGVALEGAGRPAEALEEFRLAVAENPGFGPALYNLGKSLHLAGEFEEAAGYYSRALEIRATPATHVDLGAALESVGRSEEADQHYRAALDLDPEYAEAHLNLGRSAFAGSDMDAAIAHYREALRIEPRDPRALTLLGAALSAQGDFEGAAEHYRQALAIDPLFEPAHLNVGYTLFAQGRTEEAAAHFRGMLERSPTSVLARQALERVLSDDQRSRGDTLLSEGRTIDAIAAYEQALDRSPQDAASHFGLGIALGMAGRTRESLVHMERAVELQPEWPAALAQLALLLSGAGGPDIADRARAIDLADRAARLSGGKDPAILQIQRVVSEAAGP